MHAPPTIMLTSEIAEVTILVRAIGATEHCFCTRCMSAGRWAKVILVWEASAIAEDSASGVGHAIEAL